MIESLSTALEPLHSDGKKLIIVTIESSLDDYPTTVYDSMEDDITFVSEENHEDKRRRDRYNV